MTTLYSTEAASRTPADVAKFFASEYWAQPRKVAKLWSEGGRTFFKVKDGVRVYEIVSTPAVRFVSQAVYQVQVTE